MADWIMSDGRGKHVENDMSGAFLHYQRISLGTSKIRLSGRNNSILKSALFLNSTSSRQILWKEGREIEQIWGYSGCSNTARPRVPAAITHSVNDETAQRHRF